MLLFPAFTALIHTPNTHPTNTGLSRVISWAMKCEWKWHVPPLSQCFVRVTMGSHYWPSRLPRECHPMRCCRNAWEQESNLLSRVTEAFEIPTKHSLAKINWHRILQTFPNQKNGFFSFNICCFTGFSPCVYFKKMCITTSIFQIQLLWERYFLHVSNWIFKTTPIIDPIVTPHICKNLRFSQRLL